MSNLDNKQVLQLENAIKAGLFRRINKLLKEEEVDEVQIESFTLQSMRRHEKVGFIDLHPNMQNEPANIGNVNIELMRFETFPPICTHGFPMVEICQRGSCSWVCDHL